MRQSRTSRLLSFLLMPLLATGSWIAPALEVCPMHGSPGSAHATASITATPAPSAHAAHVGHGAPTTEPGVHAARTTAGNDTSEGAADHGCDCVGCCCGTNGPALPGVQIAVAPAAEVVRETRDVCQAGIVTRRIAHVLPFATAPPVLHS